MNLKRTFRVFEFYPFITVNQFMEGEHYSMVSLSK